jgi:DNA-directed RNA polymerase alpha subunit
LNSFPTGRLLSVKGPGTIRARDLKLPDFIYVDANQHIATLTTNGNLNMKFIIACGKNHITHSPELFNILVGFIY